MSLQLDPRAYLDDDTLRGPLGAVAVPLEQRAAITALVPGAPVDDVPDALAAVLDEVGARLSTGAGFNWPPSTKGTPVWTRARVVGEGPLAAALRVALEPLVELTEDPGHGALAPLTVFAPESTDVDGARERAEALVADGPVLVVTAFGDLVEIGPLLLDPALCSGLSRPERHLGAARDLDPGDLHPHLKGVLHDALFGAAWRRTVVRGEQWWLEDLPEPPRTSIRAEAELLDIRRILNPELAPLWPAVGEAMRAGDLVNLPNAMRPEIAKPTWAALDDAERAFGPYEGRDAPGQFHYRHHRLFDLDQEPAELRTLRLIFGSEPTRRFIEQLTGDDCDDDVTVSASWFQPGEYQLPHSDNVDNRRVAFVWHLTRGWAGDQGGELHWCPTGTSIPPLFNALSLFHTAGGNKHMVTPVAPFAKTKRLAVNGWWRSRAGLLESPPPPSGRLLDARLRVRALPAFR